ncbi:MAG: molybdopterin-dependent oxidoreductase [Chloroflexi bacterium]|nr:molybdopterin-dependent oxidoreductase [Chloroflexota bacterium]
MDRGDRGGPGVWLSLLVAAVATTAAMLLMFWTRSAFQIRTLPERVMEWVLLFIPPDVFEGGIGRFGPQAKVYALYFAVAVMALILLASGMALLRGARSALALWLMGPLLYLFAMGVVMPVTGAGLFGAALTQVPALVNACYLAIGLSYSTLLLLGRAFAPRPTTYRPTAAGSTAARAAGVGPRRELVLGLIPTLAAYAGVLWFGRRGGVTGSNLPLVTIQVTPQPGAAPAAPVDPTSAAALSASRPSNAPVEPPPATPAAEPMMAAPAAQPPVASLPTPKPMKKQLTRDKDGSLTAGVRQPGTLAELITPVEAHYHVTKNPVADPVIKPEDWRLVLDGEFQRPVQLDYHTLRLLPSVEVAKTLECISNLTDKCELVPFGCELIGTARWRGVRLRTLIEQAGGFKPGVASVQLVGADEFVSAIPPEVALDPNTLVAFEMDGDVLPYEHGYPARVLTPNHYGFKSAKWVIAIRPTTREVRDWYAQRNWNKDGIVKSMTRIDVPAPGASLPAGAQRIAGIAYAGDRGVSKVEYSTNGGQSWQEARLLEPSPGKDAWVRWEGGFQVASGASMTLTARLTEGNGTLQIEEFSLAQPDGASGWNSITVRGA